MKYGYDDMDVATGRGSVFAWLKQPNVCVGLILSTFFINLLSLAFPLVFLQVYDRIIPNQAYSTLILLVVGVVVAMIFENLLRTARGFINAWMDARFEYQLNSKTFHHIMHSQEKDYQKLGSGVHLEQLNSLSALKDMYGGQAVTTLLDLPFLLIYLGLIGYLGGWLVLIPLSVFSMALAFAYLNGLALKETLEKRRTIDGYRMNFVFEVLKGLHTVKTMAMECFMVRRYERLQQSSVDKDYTICMLTNKGQSLTSFFSQLSMVLIVVAGSLQIIAGEMTMGVVAACTLLTSRALQPLGQLTGLWKRLQSVQFAQKKLKNIFSLQLERDNGMLSAEVIQGNIAFQNATYFREDKPLFQEIDLSINAKEMVVLTGENLSGKSTLLKLLARSDQLEQGHILVDGVDVNEFELQSLREKIAYIPHDPAIFNGTILENITNFSTQPLYDDVETLAVFLQISDIVSQLPNGYDTLLDQQSTCRYTLGFLQRIAIARALLHEPQVILFDEVELGVDTETMSALVEIIHRLKGSYTLLMASDNAKFLQMADSVYHLKSGKLRKR